MQIMKLLVITN